MCKYLVSNKKNMSDFHPIEVTVVGRGIDAQLQVDENLYEITSGWVKNGYDRHRQKGG